MFDVAVLPTYFPGESLPNSVIEYLYASKPVIATDTGDIKNMISHEDQRAGFLIALTSSNRPSSDDLYVAMKAYLTTPELITEHTEIAKLAFQKFDMDSCLESYLELYTS
jgi:glycosyltransferase involved in cell wall biosynthesis